MKKIAYLLSAYTYPETFKNLINVLNNEEADFYIHIDKKVNIKPFKDGLNSNNIFFLNDKKRAKVSWASFSQITMQYNLITEALNSKEKYKKIINLTGTDYPLKKVEEINKKLLEDKEYIIGYKLSDNDSEFLFKKVINKHITKYGNKIFQLFELLNIKKYKSYKEINYDIYFGSEYWCLSYNVLKDLIDIWDKDTKIHSLIKNAFAPSEIWIHTLFFNSKYRDKGELYKGIYNGLNDLSPLIYFRYDSNRPKILNNDDYKEIKESNKLFARKLILGQSDKLIDLIEKDK